MNNKILNHPDHNCYTQTWNLNDMLVTVERADKKPLMAYEAIAALERVRFQIVAALHNE